MANPLLQCASCKLLPLKSWYPVDVTASPAYEFAFILQFFGQIFVGVGKFNVRVENIFRFRQNNSETLNLP